MFHKIAFVCSEKQSLSNVIVLQVIKYINHKTINKINHSHMFSGNSYFLPLSFFPLW